MVIQTFYDPKQTSQRETCAIIPMSLSEQEEIIQHALRCLEDRIKHSEQSIRMPEDVRQYLRLQLATEQNEVFAVLFLDSAHHVIAFEKLFFGTINATAVYPRVVVQKALQHNAAAVILAHNHPSGNTQPSMADEVVTQRLKNILKEIDVTVLDHFIVSVEGYYSFAEQGLL